ncbi:unnamed protein product [Schistocephalus solidus]|uniref:BRO1 domain-containing protein n=1 Tax=Schistocephalus solidus TaxID=70667 RepID=A0A183SSD2_SCHSO|nr:unnamed protein product [Schistocephalus solidus]
MSSGAVCGVCANFYERRAEVALKNISKYIHLLEKNYTDAVACLRNAIGFLESAQAELPEMDDERSICDLRLSELHRRLELMRPYRFLKSCHFDEKHALGTAALNTAFLDRKLSTPLLRTTNGPCVADWDPEHSDWTFCRTLSTGADAVCLAKKYPKSQDQLLEESSIRIRELTKMVDDLSEQLNDAKKRAADEFSQRLNIEAELLACQLDYRTSLSNSMYAGYLTSSKYTPCNSMTQSFSFGNPPSELNPCDLPSKQLPISLSSTPS